MAWSNSKIFTAFLEDALNNDVAFALDTDTMKAALFDNTITPDQTVSAANSTYNAGVWLTAAEVEDTTNWDAGGEPITTDDWTAASNVLTYDGADTPQGGASCTLTDAYGVFVHDSSVTNRGLSYNYLGGANSVVAGSFTIVWNGSGIFSITA